MLALSASPPIPAAVAGKAPSSAILAERAGLWAVLGLAFALRAVSDPAVSPLSRQLPLGDPRVVR